MRSVVLGESEALFLKRAHHITLSFFAGFNNLALLEFVPIAHKQTLFYKLHRIIQLLFVDNLLTKGQVVLPKS